MNKTKNDNEFLLEMLDFLGEENFTRLIDITSFCVLGSEISCKDYDAEEFGCGKCFCKHIKELNKK